MKKSWSGLELDAEPEGPYETWAKETAATLRQKSPTSLKIALQQMLRGKALSLAEALQLEFRLASHLVTTPDFKEGIDAKIAGKGRAPKWTPETAADVDDSRIASLFETPVDGELELNEPKQIFQ